MLVARHAPSGELHYGEAFTRMLESIRDAYAANAENGHKPYIDDPGLPGSSPCGPKWPGRKQRQR